MSADPVRTDETTEHDIELGCCIICVQPIMESEFDDCPVIGRYAVHPECATELS